MHPETDTDGRSFEVRDSGQTEARTQDAELRNVTRILAFPQIKPISRVRSVTRSGLVGCERVRSLVSRPSQKSEIGSCSNLSESF